MYNNKGNILDDLATKQALVLNIYKLFIGYINYFPLEGEEVDSETKALINTIFTVNDTIVKLINEIDLRRHIASVLDDIEQQRDNQSVTEVRNGRISVEDDIYKRVKMIIDWYYDWKQTQESEVPIL